MDLFDVWAWHRVDDGYAMGETWRRTLGVTECGFYWDTVLDGTAITINHLVLEAEPGFERSLFERENVETAWLRLKQRFPLLGSSTEENADSDRVDFVLNTDNLRCLRPGEVNYLQHLQSPEDVELFSNELRNGETPLDHRIIARVWVGPQLDTPHIYHVWIPVAHYITDGMGDATVIREFCQELASFSKEAVFTGPPLEVRLRSLLPAEALTPSAKLSLPKRRWRLAIAKVMQLNRRAKMSGGHTLPMRSSGISSLIAQSCTQRVGLSLSDSKTVMDGCRALGLTIGSAFPVLNQVATSRVLHRLRSRGLITDEDWEHRIRQPMYFLGPLNYRPYLDQQWYATGGEDEVMIAIGYSVLTLPSMPTSQVVDATGAPPLSALLSHARFLARVRMAKAQARAMSQHPLFHELLLLWWPERNRNAREAALAWRKTKRRQQRDENSSLQSPGLFESIAPCVFTSDGASLGMRDRLIPYEYPLPPSSGTPHPPVCFRLTSTHDLRCRPRDLYLGSSSTHGQLSFTTFIDANTFDPELVLEWMEEVKEAALFYLGGVAHTTQPRQAKL